MPNLQTDHYAPATAANSYRASVPISVYRELAAELQATQAMMDSINAQNQQLVQQNQQLRQEVTKVLQSTENLQKVFTSLDSANQVREVPSSRVVRKPEPRPAPPKPKPQATTNFPPNELPPPSQQPEPPRSPYKETLVIEQEERRPRSKPQSEGVSEVSGWWLIVAILLIVLTAFGTGFLIIRPLLNNDSSR
ncbi:MAG: hypothetical protein F6K41_00120 [Symploca sp. SIO3E6]|nr:hypothetical protein [Caldora sp. SIO3E6]